MSNIETTSNALAETILNNASSKLNESASDRIERLRKQADKLSSALNYANASLKLNENASERIERIRKQAQDLPSVLDFDTLSKLKNGEYEISLKEYTTMNAYNAKMSALYGDNSASKFQKNLNTILGTDDDTLANAKNFVDKMKENGLSNSSAVKLYSAIKSYSILSSFNNYNFVKATV